MKKHDQYLQLHLDSVESGLIDDLLSRKVLSPEQLEIIELAKSEMMRNRALLDILSARSDYNNYEEFLVSLWKTNQVHLARYIIYDGSGKAQIICHLHMHHLFII